MYVAKLKVLRDYRHTTVLKLPMKKDTMALKMQ